MRSSLTGLFSSLHMYTYVAFEPLMFLGTSRYAYRQTGEQHNGEESSVQSQISEGRVSIMSMDPFPGPSNQCKSSSSNRRSLPPVGSSIHVRPGEGHDDVSQ
jgi:hypothetical protein